MVDELFLLCFLINFNKAAKFCSQAEAIMQRIADGDNIEEDKSTLLITCDQVLIYIWPFSVCANFD